MDIARVRMSRERERLIEQNRKLRLEKASLENLRRVEPIALRDLGLRTPPPETLVVVEQPAPARDGALLAGGRALTPAPGAPEAPKAEVN